LLDGHSCVMFCCVWKWNRWKLYL